MLSVSFLAAALNIMIFIAALTGVRIAERAVRNFSIAHLKRSGKSLVVHDSDLVPFSIPWSIFKYRRHPSTCLSFPFPFRILTFCHSMHQLTLIIARKCVCARHAVIVLTFVIYTSLLWCEMFAELGVDMTHDCQVSREYGPVLLGPGVGRPHDSVKEHIQMYMTLLNLLSTKFNKPEVQSVHTGFPKHFREDVCFSCLDNDENVPLLENCTVEAGESIPAGAASIGLRGSRLENDFRIGIVGVLVDDRSDAPYGRMYSGDGALTYIGDHAVALFFHGSVAPSGRLELGYMEYDNEAQLSAISKHFVENAGNPNTWAETTWVKTQVSVQTQRIHCGINLLSLESFRAAMYMTRRVQVQNILRPVDPARFEGHRPIQVRDVYLAGYGLVLTNGMFQDGYYQVHTACGRYVWRYVGPYFTSYLVLVGLLLIAEWMKDGGRKLDIPYSSRGWCAESLKQWGAANDLAIHPQLNWELRTDITKLVRFSSREMHLIGSAPSANVDEVGNRSSPEPTELETVSDAP